MRSTFSGFNTSISGLFASQRSLDVIGHNIANQNTPGYTRQRANQVTSSPTRVEKGEWLGTGVKMDHIRQIRDELLDIKYRGEVTKKGYWSEKSASLKQIEDIFGEPNGNGLSIALDGFFKSIDAVIQNSDDPTAKANFVETSMTLTRFVNKMERDFEKMIADADEEINALVVQVNTKTEQIARLNKSIVDAEVGGGTANDLRDKRNMLIDELSEMVGISVTKSIAENSSGKKVEHIQISVAGMLVVDHDYFQKIIAKPDQLHPLYEDSQKYNQPKTDDLKELKVTELQWKDTQKIDMNRLGGKLGSILQQRDSYGDPSMGCPVKGIPYYVRTVNEFMRTFAKKANEIHKQGIDANGDQGGDIFTIEGNSAEINARNIRVNVDIVNSQKKLAIGKNKDESDTNNFQALYDLRNSSITVSINQNVNGHFRTLDIGKGNPEDVIKSMITSVLGVDAKEAKDSSATLDVQVLMIDMQRMSVSGVSENEELTNMVKFQHAYNASARMITTIDEMIDVLINRMGRVGL